MNQSRHSVASVLALCVFAAGLDGCDGSKKQVKKPAATGATLDGPYDPEKQGLKVIDPRPKVSAFSLDDQVFQLVGVRVGMQDYMSSQSPAITFMRPEMADYVEILRCSKDTVITAGVESIENLQVGTSQGSELSQIMQQNDFWGAAEKSNGCTLIAQGYSDKQIFIDGFAPSGGYRWIIRSCVAAERLADVAQLSTRNCSRQVGVSPVVEDYKNDRQEAERLAIEEALKERDKMDGIGMAVYYKTVEYNNALTACNGLEEDRAKGVQKKRAIGMIVGQGVGLAANFYAAGAGQGLGKSFSWSQAAKGAWQTGSSSGIGSLGGGLGTNLGASINDLFTTSSDFARTCSNANKIQNEGAVLAQQLKASHELFAAKMDQAEVLRQNRVSLENQ